MKLLTIISLLLASQLAFSQEDSAKSLVNETMLHPGDAFTAYVYKKGEWGYNQAITPYPSWAWWGITDWLTAEVDIEAWLGGVPSFNFRVGLLKADRWKPAVAYETMFQYLGEERDQFHNLNYLDIERQGANWYNHLNFSWKIGDRFHVHLSGGATYSENLTISNGLDSTSFYKGRSFNKSINPDFSIGLDWRIKRGITLHSTASYGSTFLYADNIPRKQQFTFGSRMAPFIKSKSGFLNCFRFELSFLHNNYPDASTGFSGPIGFLYWQWDWSKENRERRKAAKNQQTLGSKD